MAFKTSSKQKISTSSAVFSSIGTGGSGTGPVITSRYITNSSYTNLDDTAIATAGGYIKLIGTGFASGCTVYVNSIAATTTTFVSTTEVRAAIPAATNGTYSLTLFNSSGSGAIFSSGLTFSGFPSITTSVYANAGNVISTQLVGTGDGTLTYSLQGGSTLPAGVTLSSTGLISGTASAITTATVLSFTVLVDDSQLQTTQQAITLSISFGDVNFNNTVLLLNGDGVADAITNNTFIDSSTNNVTVTRTGTPTQGTISPFSPTGWSTYFNGTTDKLTSAANVAHEFGTGDFTVEFWMYSPVAWTGGTAGIIGKKAGDAGAGWQIYRDSGTPTKINFRLGGSNNLFSTSTPATGIWEHWALVRSGTTVNIYKNGILDATGTNSVNITDAGGLSIGMGDSWASSYANVYLSNIRIVKGTAVYTTAFTPPTVALTAITNTTLLMCQSNRFKDNSTNNFTITPTGTPSVQTLAPFGATAEYSTTLHGGSTYFNGTTDYITVPTNAAYAFGAGDFTIECWLYVNGTAGNYTIFDNRTAGSSATVDLYFNGSMFLCHLVNGTNQITSTLVSSFTWNHIAVSRSSGSTKIFINGVQSGVTYADAITYVSGIPTIGHNSVAGGGANWFPGYISNLRIVKGTAVYTTTFTPPTAPLTAITNTSMLLNFANAGIRDVSSKTNLLTTGTAKTSTTIKKYGSGSLSFNGTTDYVNTMGTNPMYGFGLGDFTIEFWVYFNAVGVQTFIFDGAIADPSITASIYMTGSSEIKYFTSATDAISSGQIMAINTWYHIAVVRASLSTKLYINGTNYGSAYADNRTYIATLDRPVIGRRGSGANSFLNGYIDDLRITKMARYTASFTPPTILLGS